MEYQLTAPPTARDRKPPGQGPPIAQRRPRGAEPFTPVSSALARGLQAAVVLLSVLGLASIAWAQESLTNGARHTGEIASASDAQSWTFPAEVGEAIFVRVGATNFTPRIRLFDSGNALVGETTSGNSFVRDGFLTAQAASAGTYTVLVSATYPTQTGTYALHFAQAPGPIAVSAGDDGGTLTNGEVQPGRIELGDLDVWSVTAGVGATLLIRAGAVDVTPWIRLYGPDGALVGESDLGNTFARDNFLVAETTNAGPHTLVISAKYAGQVGDYALTVAQAPGEFTVSAGDQGGVLTNGVFQAGVIPLGDLDVWQFEANAGDSLFLRAGTTSFTPWMKLFGPDGALVGEVDLGNTFARDNFLTARATNTGPHTLVITAKYAGQSGEYGLTLARAPGEFVVLSGDEGGSLTNGFAQPGVIALGDLDLWQFEANAGDSLFVRAGSTNFTPWIRLYGPDGALAGEVDLGNSFARDNVLIAEATNTGPHTIVISARYTGQEGGYALTLVRAPGEPAALPGDEGGALTNAVVNSGTLALGDADAWSFFGTPGDSNIVRVVSTNFTPWIRLYGPDGSLAGEANVGNSFTRENTLRAGITEAGLYTVVLSAKFTGQSGGYSLKQSRVPPDLIVPADAAFDETSPLSLSISAQDPDEPVKPLVFALISGPPGMTLASDGATNAVISWTPAEADGPSTNLVTASVTDVVNGQSFIRTNQFAIVIEEVNGPPQLNVPADQVAGEMIPLNVAASATDADLPANSLAFSLLSPPTGMAIDPSTGAISWTPSEEQGPSTNVVSVVVTDSSPFAVNATTLSATNTFTVVVNEINRPPQLVLPSAQTVDELSGMTGSVAATDPDLPANALVFALVASPEGMRIDAATGVVTWTPTEAQGPSTNVVAVRVQDNGTPPLDAVATFTVVVSEVNRAPTLEPIADTSLHFGDSLSIQAVASDSDVPANALHYSAEHGPEGLRIDPSSGAITWNPTPSQTGNHPVAIRVTDNGNPNLDATTTFRVTVTGDGSRVDAARLASGLVQITISGDTGQTYELQKTQDLKEWVKVLEFRLDTSPFHYIDPESTGGTRFYRLKLVTPQ